MLDDLVINEYNEEYFDGIVEMYKEVGWMTFVNRKEDAKNAWKESDICLVVLKDNMVKGFLRALSDKNITTYIAELLVDKGIRGKGIGKRLIEKCYEIYPGTRVDLLSSESADDFYRNLKFREILGFRR